jgi:plastocyanin
MRRTAKYGLVCVSILVAGCGGGAEEKASPPSLEVGVKDFKFLPKEVTVRTGDAVTFSNGDKAPHTAEGEGFDTGRLDRGQSKRIEFAEPGTYEYFCDFHRFMTGTVEVTE